MSKTVRWAVVVDAAFNQRINKIAEQSNCPKIEILQKAMILIEVAFQEQDKGNHLAIVGEDGKIIKDIVGL